MGGHVLCLLQSTRQLPMSRSHNGLSHSDTKGSPTTWKHRMILVAENHRLQEAQSLEQRRLQGALGSPETGENCSPKAHKKNNGVVHSGVSRRIRLQQTVHNAKAALLAQTHKGQQEGC
mmetsp:Transcript_6459/g.15709  ORF Transcript_6459/g.15709 Transcript_6459/m.15709 type:complete len:119 (+) Transcript_6459:3409-3765(+)